MLTSELTAEQRLKLQRDRWALLVERVCQGLNLMDETLAALADPDFDITPAQRDAKLAHYQGCLSAVQAAGQRLTANPISFTLDEDDDLTQFEEAEV